MVVIVASGCTSVVSKPYEVNLTVYPYGSLEQHENTCSQVCAGRCANFGMVYRYSEITGPSGKELNCLCQCDK